MLSLTSVKGVLVSENLVNLISGGDAATMSALRDACSAHVRGSGLDPAGDLSDLISEAVLSVLEGRADTIKAAAAAGFAATRRDRLNGQRVEFSYLSQSVRDDEGEVSTLGDVLADRVAAPEVDFIAERAEALESLARAAGVVRVRKGYAAHGSVMARGEANALRGALNDADVLRALEAVGGRRYGYAAAMVRWFASEGIITTANAVRVAVFRALSRTERGWHSSRD
jgi:hypothetical protein